MLFKDGSHQLWDVFVFFVRLCRHNIPLLSLLPGLSVIDNVTILVQCILPFNECVVVKYG